MPERQIHFDNEGQRLYGMLHLPEGQGSHPGVVLLHGFTGNSKEAHFMFVKAARAFARNGLAALRFDFRGSGDSEGDFVNMTAPAEISDTVAALDFLSSQPVIDKERMGLLGLSLGGCVGASTAGFDARVKSLVLWSAAAFSSTWQEVEGVAVRGPIQWLLPEQESALRRQGWFDIGGLRLGVNFVDRVQEVEPLAAIAKYQGPVLIVHGTEDETVPVADAHAYYGAASGQKELLLIDGADHVYNSCLWEERVIGASCRWFVDTLAQ